MHKNFLRSTALACTLFATACTETESALIEDPNQTTVEQPVPKKTTDAPVKKIEVAHNDRSKPVRVAPSKKSVEPQNQPVAAAPEQAVAQVQTTTPTTQPAPRIVTRTPFPVKK